MKLTPREVLVKAIERWGVNLQVFMFFEEAGELMQAIVKHLRKGGKEAAIAEEIADVRIMLDQLEVMFDIEDRCEDEYARKMERLERTVSAEETL